MRRVEDNQPEGIIRKRQSPEIQNRVRRNLNYAAVAARQTLRPAIPKNSPSIMLIKPHHP
jgi:hypothetical protein